MHGWAIYNVKLSQVDEYLKSDDSNKVILK